MAHLWDGFGKVTDEVGFSKRRVDGLGGKSSLLEILLLIPRVSLETSAVSADFSLSEHVLSWVLRHQTEEVVESVCSGVARVCHVAVRVVVLTAAVARGVASRRISSRANGGGGVDGKGSALRGQ